MMNLLIFFVLSVIQAKDINPGECQILLKDYNVYDLKDLDYFGRTESTTSFDTLSSGGTFFYKICVEKWKLT